MSEIIEEGQFSDAEEDTTFAILNRGKDKFVSHTDPVEQISKEITDLYVEEDETDDFIDDSNCNWDICDDDNRHHRSFFAQTTSGHTNTQNVSSKVTSYQPRQKLFRRYANRINLEKYEGPPLPNHVVSVLINNDKRVDKDRIRIRDKKDRATVESVLDKRTGYILHKLLNQGFIETINGCVSTGKEANVYYAELRTGVEAAIKIYKTSILEFKDRDKYVTGDYRFRHGYCRHNSRKMVQTWAEKEFRNLMRLHQSAVKAPKPLMLRGHVLLMEFCGENGWSAPKLKDATLTTSELQISYRECIEIMWKIYNICKLVHADLSEYNILYHDGSIVIIDVSQSVEHDHPMALEFLRKDCSNITEFFKKKGINVMPMKALFDFITDPTIKKDNMEQYLDRVYENMLHETNQESDPQQQVEEEVFKHAYIPQRLTQVIDIERDIKLAKSGEVDLIYKTVIGLKANLSEPMKTPEILADECNKSNDNLNAESDTENSDDSGDENDSTSDTQDGNTRKFVNSARPKNESLESKKARKKAVKELQAEKRKEKVKKHVKKRKEKLLKKK